RAIVFSRRNARKRRPTSMSNGSSWFIGMAHCVPRKNSRFDKIFSYRGYFYAYTLRWSTALETIQQTVDALLGERHRVGIVGRPQRVEEAVPGAGIEESLDVRLGFGRGHHRVDLRSRDVHVGEAVVQLHRTGDAIDLVEVVRNAERIDRDGGI